MSDRTIILRHGAIVEMGATEKVFGNPQHEYTRMLMSSVPELHKKWQHTPLGPAALAGNGSAIAAETTENGPNRPAVAVALEPPALTEFEPGQLVAQPE